MKVTVKRLFNNIGQETGSILREIMSTETTEQNKHLIESKLIQYAENKLYQGEGLNIYSDKYIDTPSVIIIKK